MYLSTARMLLPSLVRRGTKVAISRNALTSCFTRTLTATTSQQSHANANLIEMLQKQQQQQQQQQQQEISDTNASDSPPPQNDAVNFQSIEDAKNWVLMNLESEHTVTKLTQIYKERSSPVAEIIDAVTQQLIKEDKFDSAHDFTEDIVQAGIKIRYNIYNEILDQFVKERQRKEDEDIEHRFTAFIHLMSEKGYQTGEQQMYHILRMAAVAGNVQLADIFFAHLIDGEVFSKKVLHGLVLRAHINEARKENDFSNLEALVTRFNEVLDNGIVLNEVTVTRFIENCVLGDVAGDARNAVTKQAENADFYHAYVDLLERITPKLRSKNVKAARRIYGKTKYRNLCENYLKSFFDIPDTRSVIQVRDDIISDFDEAEAPEKVIQLVEAGYTKVNNVVDAVVEHLIKDSQVQQATAFTENLVEKGISIQAQTYDRLVEHFIKNNQVQQATAFAENLVEKGISIQAQTYDRLLRGLADQKRADIQEQRGSGDKQSEIDKTFYSFVTFMAEKGYIMTTRGKRTVLHMASLLGNSQLAQVTFNELKAKDGVSLLASDYGLVISALCLDARNKKDYSNQGLVTTYFKEAIENKLELIDHNVKLFIENSVLSGTPDDARTLLVQLSKDSSVYLEYLELLVRIEPLLSRGAITAARKVCRETKYKGAERFIRLYY